MASKGKDYLQKANHMVKEAKECVKTGLFKWKPDYERASIKFVDAAKFYRLAGDKYQPQYVACLKEAANAFENIESYHMAAKNLEEAARSMEKTKTDTTHADTGALYAKAALLHQLNQHPDKAAALYVKAGKAAGESDMKQAVEYFSSAVSVFEDEDRAKFSNDSFKQMIGYLMRKKDVDATIELIKRQNGLYQSALEHFQEYLYRNFLELIVLYFVKEQYALAQKELQEMMLVSSFATTEQCAAAEAMVQAYLDADAQALKDVCGQQTFTFLDNEVARCAKRLELNVEVAKKTAAENTEQQDNLDGIDFT